MGFVLDLFYNAFIWLCLVKIAFARYYPKDILLYSASNDNVGGYIGYTFPSAVAIKKVMLYNYTTNQSIITKFKLQGSNGTWTDIGTEQNATTGVNNYNYPSNNTTYTSHRVYCTAYASGGANNLNVWELQFYGRQDV